MITAVAYISTVFAEGHFFTESHRIKDSFPDVFFPVPNTKLSQMNFTVVFHSYVSEIMKVVSFKEINIE